MPASLAPFCDPDSELISGVRPTMNLPVRYRPGLALAPAVLVDERVGEDPKEPGLQVRALPELVEGPERAKEGLLHQILRVRWVLGQAKGTRVQAGKER